jgi:hypothetical protein
VTRSFAFEITAGDFALVGGSSPYRHQLRGRILKPLRWPPQILTRDDGRLNTGRWCEECLSLAHNGNKQGLSLAGRLAFVQ